MVDTNSNSCSKYARLLLISRQCHARGLMSISMNDAMPTIQCGGVRIINSPLHKKSGILRINLHPQDFLSNDRSLVHQSAPYAKGLNTWS